jgi:putative endonuclease
MPTPASLHKKNLGQLGEKLAAEFLQKHGLKILERNFKCHGGEIDLIAEEQSGMLVFVEVRTRAGKSFGTASESITPWKTKKLITAAWMWLNKHNRAESPWRLDVVTLDRTGTNQFQLQYFPGMLE